MGTQGFTEGAGEGNLDTLAAESPPAGPSPQHSQGRASAEGPLGCRFTRKRGGECVKA